MKENEDTSTFEDLPNLRHLRAFSLTAHHKSVKRAALDIFLSQPAVTQAIGNLEAQFGQTLFERRTNGMFVTEVGAILIKRVNRALAELVRACRPPEAKSEKDDKRPDPTRLLSASQLRIIVAISDHGNFTMAARALGMSRPSVQRTARNLEKVVNRKLFVRSSRGISISAAGEHFARCTKLAVREIELAREEIDQYWGHKVGRIVVGSLPLSLVEVVPVAIMRVLEEIPDLNVSIVEGPYKGQLEGLRNGDVDMVVGALRDKLPCDDVVQRSLFDDQLSVVVRAGHPLTRQASLTLSDTVGYAWILPPPGTPTREMFHKAFQRRAQFEPKRILEVSSHASLRALLTRSDRVALISERQIRYELEAGTLCVLPVELSDTMRRIGLATRADWEPSAAQKMFIQELEDIVNEFDSEEHAEAGISRIQKDTFQAPV